MRDLFDSDIWSESQAAPLRRRDGGDLVNGRKA
jgi:hypothetical protein